MGALLQTRQIYGAQIDEVLYGSADSYAQSRLVYLQSRRFELRDIASDDYIDPYAEFE
jgi:phospholipid-binding lipoprotein MlaA